MKWPMLALTMIVVGACSVNQDLERLSQTEFTPIGNSAFEYKALASPVLRPEDSSDAELERITWLERYLTDNGLCPYGYEIIERRAVLLITGLLGASYDIFYTGRCK